MDQPSRVIVMKVGVHHGEPWEAIVERKLAEERVAGVVYWLRTSNARSVFSGVRLRANVAKRAKVRKHALYLVWKIVQQLGQHWRALNGSATVMTLVLAGARFEDGILVDQPPREEVQAAWSVKLSEVSFHAT